MKTQKKYISFLFVFCLSIVGIMSVTAGNADRYAANSVLANGKWIQIQVKENAIYKLTYEDIKRMGINDPAKVKIHGYGGWLLNEDFSKPYHDDLPEVSVWMNKGSDGIFNAGDYLLFYGRGPVKWSYNTSKAIYEHQNNPYSTFGSYFLTEGESGPKEMELKESYANTTRVINTFDDYLLHERDSLSHLNSGRELFGESFVGKHTQNFTFNVPGITSDAGIVRLSFAAAPSATTPVTVSVGSSTLLSMNISSFTSTYKKADLQDRYAIWNGDKSESFTATINYNASGNLIANLNFLVFNVVRKLQFYNTGYTFFRNCKSPNVNTKYEISNASSGNHLVWDITDNYDTKLQETTLLGTTMSFGVKGEDLLREYVMVDTSKSFPVPTVLGEIKNQNLHNYPQLDMVILAPDVYTQYANTLAEKHREVSNLNVRVVHPEWIYNEFSSGVPDATAIRRFMKMFYDRAQTDEEKPKYLLLFGDGIFDNRFLTKQVSGLNRAYFLPTFQVLESTDETSSYGTDDYFGFLEDNSNLSLASNVLNLSIGRFPVSSKEQANNAVQKVINYMDNKLPGKWKNKIIFTADDTDSYSKPSFCKHADQAEKLSNYLEGSHPEYMLTKSFMDAFKSVNVNGKKTYPDAKNKFLTSLKDGALLLNYTGHGSTTAWSSEDMLNVTDVRQMSFEALPLWITATCDFGWYDNVNTSAGEEAFLNKKSGAIALYTTSRVVFSENNYAIHDKIIRNLFTKKDGKYRTLGEVLRASKVEMKSDNNKLNYVLLGDPALTLNFPELSVRLDKVNDEDVSGGAIFPFKALERVKLEGVIVDEEGMVVSDFTGKINTTVFDSKQISESYLSNSEGGKFTFVDYPNMVYTGEANVVDGKFTVTFTVPLDISYTSGQGKLNFYAYDSTTGIDANGFYLNYELAGTSDNPQYVDGAPVIEYVYLNSNEFKNGDTVNETPYFVAKVIDGDGINMTGTAIGHDIMLYIDNMPAYTYSLNSYYFPIDDTSGEIRFSIPTLPAGEHELLFRVWDILNNSSTATVSFKVELGMTPSLYSITALNSPAKDITYFQLEHDRPETAMEVDLRVYDLMGREVWRTKESGSSSWLKSIQIEWNLTDNAGNRVKPGVYVYKGSIKTPNSKEATKAKKIVVLGQ